MLSLHVIVFFSFNKNRHFMVREYSLVLVSPRVSLVPGHQISVRLVLPVLLEPGHSLEWANQDHPFSSLHQALVDRLTSANQVLRFNSLRLQLERVQARKVEVANPNREQVLNSHLAYQEPEHNRAVANQVPYRNNLPV